MDPFAVLLGIFLLLVVGSNMLAFALGVVRFKELLGKQAGEQEDGDDDLKEVICQASSRSLGSGSTGSRRAARLALACDNNNLVEKTGGEQEGCDDDLKEVICVT